MKDLASPEARFSATNSTFDLISEWRSSICLWISSTFSLTDSEVPRMYCSRSSRDPLRIVFNTVTLRILQVLSIEFLRDTISSVLTD